MFIRIRWALVRWNVAVFGLILLLVGGGAYATAAKRLPIEIDRDLESQVAALGGFPRAVERDELRRTGYRGGYVFLALGAGGEVLANPQGVAVPALPIPAPGDYEPSFATVEVNGEPIRFYIRPLPVPNGPGGSTNPDRALRPVTLIVGQSLVPAQNALRRLLVGLIAGGLAGVLLLFAGAWFLAGRALVPIETAFRRQQEFIADASHELRTPLTVLRSSADLLDRHRAEPLAANGELFDDLRDGLVRLERLANDLLTLARSDLGGQNLELAVAPLDLGPFAADVARRTAPLARLHGLTLACDVPAEALELEVDPDRLHQVLLILLDNAIAHTPVGGTVTLGVARHGNEARLSVRDTGEGIAPDDLARIFDRFYRADPARSRAVGGAGLGLAIARILVELHGGRIELASVVGEGTTATITLPCAEPAPTIVGRIGHLAARAVGRGA